MPQYGGIIPHMNSFFEFSAVYFAKRNLNGGGFQSDGGAEGDA